MVAPSAIKGAGMGLWLIADRSPGTGPNGLNLPYYGHYSNAPKGDRAVMLLPSSANSGGEPVIINGHPDCPAGFVNDPRVRGHSLFSCLSFMFSFSFFACLSSFSCGCLWSMVYAVYVLCSMVYGLWSMVYGLWSMVYGLWSMIYGLWSMVYGLWSMVYGPWSMATK
jgi:hypothetical protein